MLSDLWISFTAGLLTPLGAVCVLPLYPGYIAYLAKAGGQRRGTNILLGLLVMAGVMASLMAVGGVVTWLIGASLTTAIGIVSPIAFGVLLLLGILLTLGLDLGRLMPRLHSPTSARPSLGAFLYGVFFGGIVLPCNPAPLVVLFALSTSTTDVLTNLGNFMAFGIGMGLPLLLLATLTGGQRAVAFIARHETLVLRAIGLFMIGVSLYYLFGVFRIQTLF